jgi:hypothetical protein
MTETEKEGFKKMFEQVCGRSRWFIASNHAYTEQSGDVCYLDVSNNEWISDVQKATGFKQSYLANIVCDGLDRDLKARIVEFEVSNEYTATNSIKIEVDRQVIGHHEPSQTFLYQCVGMEALDPCSVLLHVKDTKETFLDISELGGKSVTVGLTPDAMDELAIAWCKHRKLQGVLGGPVGKEWGSPDYD